MKKFKKSLTAVLAAGTLLTAACTPPANNYYSPEIPTNGGEICPRVDIGRISAPQYLDQQQIAFRTKDGTLKFSEQNRWAEPLLRTIRRRLPERVSVLLKDKTLKKISSADIAVECLEGVPGDSVKLSANITLNFPRTETGVPASQIFFVEKNVPAGMDDGTDDGFKTYSGTVSLALEELAQSVAAALSE